MSPSNAGTDPNLEEEPLIRLQAGAMIPPLGETRWVPQEPIVAGTEEEDEEELEDDEDDEDEDEDEEEEDEDEDDEDDDVGTDERGQETLRAPGEETPARPNVSADRIVPSTDAEPEGSLDHVKSRPLGIEQIEDIEDDAKGG